MPGSSIIPKSAENILFMCQSLYGESFWLGEQRISINTGKVVSRSGSQNTLGQSNRNTAGFGDIIIRRRKSMPSSNLDRLKSLFHNRCVRCQKVGDEVHELIPRSQTKNWDTIDNQVLLCSPCHWWAHQIGTRLSTPILKQFRTQRLKEYGSIPS